MLNIPPKPIFLRYVLTDYINMIVYYLVVKIPKSFDDLVNFIYIKIKNFMSNFRIHKNLLPISNVEKQYILIDDFVYFYNDTPNLGSYISTNIDFNGIVKQEIVDQYLILEYLSVSCDHNIVMHYMFECDIINNICKNVTCQLSNTEINIAVKNKIRKIKLESLI